MTQPGSERLFVGRYKLLRSITPVGRDEAFEALDMERQQRVTVRLVRMGAGDRESLERLERELHRARDVVSPHVQRILEVGRHRDETSGVELPFLTMELLEGESLEERLRQQGPLTPQEALPLARQLCEGLATLHDAGLVHGDLRGARVILVPAPEGSRAILAAPAWAWETGNPAANAPHLAPERSKGSAPTGASDLYSLGLILLELLAGALSSPESETAALLEQLRRGSSVPTVELGLPHRWEVVIRRCMDPLPRRRFTSAREVVRTLVQPSRVQRPLDEPSVAIRTVLLLDLTDSTRLVESLGDARAAGLFARHDQLARELLHLHGGQEIDKTDGFLLLFERPVDATRYALAYHERLALLEREQGVRLQARAGIHLGEVVLRENPPHLVAQGAKPVDVEGLTKLIAARIMPLAQGGQTLMTRAAFDIARRAVVGTSGTGPGLAWRSHGFYLLAGVEEPVEVCEVGVEGNAPLTAPLDTAKARRVTLSSPSLPAIPTVPGPERGRRMRGGLLVLCGLLLAAMAGYAARRENPAPAGTQTPPGLVTQQVKPRRSVAVLGFKNLNEKPEASWLSTAFSEMLTGELAAGENLRLVSGETVVRMKRELSLTDSESLAPDTLSRIRAHLGVDFVVLGSYLALPEETGGQLSLLLRLQDASSGEEVAMLRERGTQAEILELVARMGDQLRGRLGPHGTGAADAGRSPSARPANTTALRLYAEGLARLRAYEPLKAKDFFTQAIAADPRFALAHSALAETWAVLGYDTRALEAARRALALAKGLSREEQLLVEGRVHEMEKDWAKAVDNYRTLSGLFPDNLDHGLRLASAQSSGGQGRAALDTLAALRGMGPPASEDERIDLAEAQVRHSLSDYKAVLPLADSAVKKGTARGSRLLVGRARLAQCNALLRLGNHQDATDACQQALRIFVDTGDPGSEGQTLNRLANVAYEEGNYEEAKRVFSEALRIWKNINHRSGVALALQNIADTLLMQGELALAEPLFEEALAIEQDINDRRNEGLTRINLAQLRLMRGDLVRARKLGEEGVHLSREPGYLYTLLVGLWTLGNVELEEGQLDEARRHYAEGLALSRRTQDDRYTAYHLQGAGTVALFEGDLVRARGQYEEALKLRRRLGGRSEVAETQVALGLLALEEARPEAGLEPLNAAVETLHGLGLPDGEAQAHTALALVHLARHQPALAREASTRAEALAARSQHVQTRLGSALVAARVRSAEGGHGEAVKRLEAVLAEARRKGLVPLEYEARLALAEAERAWGRLPLAWQRLRVLEENARARGLSGFVRKAQALSATLNGAAPPVAAPP